MKGLKVLFLAGATAIFSSCIGMQLATVTTQDTPNIARVAQDSSLYIAPVELNLTSSRAEFDLRDVTVSINGQEFKLGGRYLEEIEDSDLGEVGILDTNIFLKADVDTEILAKYLANYLGENISGDKDIRIPFNKNQPDAALYSSLPLIYDFSQYPWVSSVDPNGEALDPIFKEIDQNPVNADYELSISIDFRSEVFEILSTDQYIQNKHMMANHKPEKGDYYLSYFVILNYTLTDTISREIVMTEKSPQTTIQTRGIRNYTYLPIANKDADAYAKYFRSYDFTEAAEGILSQLADTMLLSFRPMYTHINKYVKVEE